MGNTIDEQIAQSLRESQASGELQSAKSWGKPLDLNDGYAQTPEELRMAFKALKDRALQSLAALRAAGRAGPGRQAPRPA